MSIWAIGDLQGCLGPTQRLLERIFVAEEQLAPISTELFAASERPARSPITLAQVQRALRSDELLIEYVLAEPSSPRPPRV